MTALDNWIADLLGNKVSDSDQPLVSQVTVAVLALQFIAGGIIPSGAQANNVFYGGPASGGPLQPTFRALAAADFATTLLLSIGNINLNSATRPANGIYLSAANTVRGSANSADIFQWAAGGLSMVAGAIVPLSTNGITGTTTNDNANAGADGEFIETVVTAAAPLAFTASGTAQDLGTMALTAGDWDVEGSLQSIPAGGTTTTLMLAGFSNTLNTLPAGERRSIFNVPIGAGLSNTIACPRVRFSLAGAATIRLVANLTFAVSTMQICGFMNARRVR